MDSPKRPKRIKLHEPFTLVRERHILNVRPSNKTAAQAIEDALNIGLVAEATVRIAPSKSIGTLELVYVRWLRKGEIPRVGSEIKVSRKADYDPSEEGWKTYGGEDDLPS